MHENFKKYLNEIGEIQKDIELNTDKDKIFYRYLEPAYHKTDSNGEPYQAYGCTNYAELIINGEVKGYFKTKYENSEFYKERIFPNNNIRRLWGSCHYIWE